MRRIPLIFFFLGFFGFPQNTSVITQLPASLSESSGLLKLNDRYYTFNDSGNTNELYEFSTIDGSIIRTISINNATNVDWEAITADNTHVFIGDIGNNNGNRTNLRVYKISIADLEAANTVTASSIDFTYEDQSDFTSNPFNTNFDAESLIATDNNLFIFTKNWIDLQSTIYQLDKSSTSQVAINFGTLATNGLVTDAFYNGSNQEITLCGYATDSYIWRLTDFNSTDFTSGQLAQFTLIIPDTNSPQIEGITEASSNIFYLSSELLSTRVPTLFSVEFSTLNLIETTNKNVKVYPNPTTNNVFFNELVDYQLYSITGILIISGKGTKLNTSNLASGTYLLNLKKGSENSMIKLIKKSD